MHSLADMCKTLNRSAVYLHKLQKAFELPGKEGDGYPDAYLAFLETLVLLRTLGISEKSLLQLWHLEKKLLQLLHADSTGSETWFLDACGQTSHLKQRLLMTHYDMGREFPPQALQYELDFSCRAPELFAGQEMGEDALRVFLECARLTREMEAQAGAEAPRLRVAADWVRRRLR